MTRRLPILPTTLVLFAVGLMIALGVWQLQRKAEKEALLLRYDRARSTSATVTWPRVAADYPAVLYRHAVLDCVEVESVEAMAGRSQDGRAGWAHVAQCRLAGGGSGLIAIGWSSTPQSPLWTGGRVEGMIGPAGRTIRLVASEPQAGLTPLAAPDPANVPNNHLSYAVQWFLFALTALVIYALALRRRGRAS